MQLVIFTDLDGTLLDKKDYAWESAQPALELCQQLKIPVFAVTSKTMTETKVVVAEIGLQSRFIFENGGGIYLGQDRYRGLGMPYGRLRRHFLQLAADFDLRGFGDLTVAEISQFTGLTLAAAARARERLFSEPFLYQGDELAELYRQAAKRDLQIIEGGRFFHLMASGQSKGAALKEFLALLLKELEGPLITVALGDSPNDFSMLAVVDYPVLLQQSHGRLADCSLDNLLIPPASGPTGWAMAVTGLINQFYF